MSFPPSWQRVPITAQYLLRDEADNVERTP